MRYVSLFSGVEAASVAWAPLGWTPVAFAEVDQFPCAVLAERFPNVPNLGDVCEIDWKEFHDKYGAIDVLVGGSPCQSFSIAGNREGLAPGAPSRLMFEYIRAIRELVCASEGKSPRYILWENVPGAFSSERGNSFGQLLAELDELGYGLAWRVLDAQFVRVPDGPRLGFFGPVPQRRRRVFLVGSLGTPGAAEILFERESLRWDHPKGRAAREALAGNAAESASIRSSAGFKWFAGARAKGIGYEDNTSPTLSVSDGHMPAVLTPWDVQSKRVNTPDGTSPTLQSGSGEGMNIQPIVFQESDNNLTPCDVQSKQVHTLDGVSPTLSAGGNNWAPINVQPIVMTTANMGNANGGNYSESGVAYTVDTLGSNAVCMQGNMIGRELENGPQGDGVNDDLSFTLNTIDRHAVAFAQNTRDEVRYFGGDGSMIDDVAFATNNDKDGPSDYVLSNGEDVIGSLCSCDSKWVQNQQVNQGKIVCKRT
ncbi:MAG: DNA cytosine methyltransferase [Atopobiaceae bacterium]|nr:DNA cytosine methyltransferase [Atopobiaceae bacterium]MBR3158490.1 DNA cytosine methyltransferase [Atopobiaceae bacterium]